MGWLLKALDRTNYKVVRSGPGNLQGRQGQEDKKEEAKAPPKKVTVVKTGKPTYKPTVPPASKPADPDFKDFSREELDSCESKTMGRRPGTQHCIYGEGALLRLYGIANSL